MPKCYSYDGSVEYDHAAEIEALRARVQAQDDFLAECETAAREGRATPAQLQMMWLTKNGEAFNSLIEGRAAVVPLREAYKSITIQIHVQDVPNKDRQSLHFWIDTFRLDKPVEK